MLEDQDEEEEADGHDQEETQLREATVLALLVRLYRKERTSYRFLVAYLTLYTVWSMFSSILSSKLPCSMTRLCNYLLRELRVWMDFSILVTS